MNRNVSHTPPDRANELFAKLLDSSEGAIQTREKLFSALKQELQLLANVQEQHLFPVMRRHKETRGLVQDALEDNRETQALLSELEATPKDGEEFTRKLDQLRKVFQQHIRDDRKELLPVILKVLSEEEVEAVVEMIEGEIAEVDESKRAEVEQRRATTRQQRQQVESARIAAGEVTNLVREGAKDVEIIARTAQESVQAGLGMASELAQRSAGEVVHLFDRSSQRTREVAEQASHRLQAVSQANTVLARGARDIAYEWLSLQQDCLLKNLDAIAALTRCRSVSDVAEVQTSLVRQNLEQVIGNGRRIAELAFDVAEAATRPSAIAAERKLERTSRVRA